jgi:hypothetical protein
MVMALIHARHRRTPGPVLNAHQTVRWAVTMTVPMVAWMRDRGHAWRPSWKMAASMFIPTFGIIALMAGGIVDDFATLMYLEHHAPPHGAASGGGVNPHPPSL